VLDLLAGSPATFIAVCGVLGLLVGSFLNVVIHRMPVMLDRQWRAQAAEIEGRELPPEPRYNLIAPRSACPGCKAPITAAHNIPVISWLFLRGKCASCGKRISARYPLVELLTGIASALVAWRFGFGWACVAGLVLTWFLIALTFIDVDTQLLPDDLTLPLLWIGILVSLTLPHVEGARLPVDLRSSVIGAIAGYLSLWSVYHLFRIVTGKEGMGYGDFKLLAALGAWLGWQMLLPIILGAAGVGAVLGIAMIVTGQRDRGIPMAFGPYLAAAGWLALMFGPELVARYLSLYGRH
jgi:leader peptidase (prepilin peptidase)/N-methyltransferase